MLRSADLLILLLRQHRPQNAKSLWAQPLMHETLNLKRFGQFEPSLDRSELEVSMDLKLMETHLIIEIVLVLDHHLDLLLVGVFNHKVKLLVPLRVLIVPDGLGSDDPVLPHADLHERINLHSHEGLRNCSSLQSSV